VSAGRRWYWLMLQVAAVAAGIYAGVWLFDAVTR
jgi:hypothetical protein